MGKAYAVCYDGAFFHDFAAGIAKKNECSLTMPMVRLLLSVCLHYLLSIDVKIIIVYRVKKNKASYESYVRSKRRKIEGLHSFSKGKTGS